MTTDDRAARPSYDEFARMADVRSPLAAALARQALETCRPWLVKAFVDLDVLDVGSGYGDTAVELARECRTVIGLEPARDLYAAAAAKVKAAEQQNLSFRWQSVEEMGDHEKYDLVILDNVYEHLPDQSAALASITRALRPGGVLYLLVPNRLWPIEAHYRLPFLSWLPLRWANRYLRITGRGKDYTDASYAPSYAALSKSLNQQHAISWQFVLPADPCATVAGAPLHYRVGMALIKRVPALWVISKALLVVAVKEEDVPAATSSP